MDRYKDGQIEICIDKIEINKDGQIKNGQKERWINKKMVKFKGGQIQRWIDSKMDR